MVSFSFVQKLKWQVSIMFHLSRKFTIILLPVLCDFGQEFSVFEELLCKISLISHQVISKMAYRYKMYKGSSNR